MYRIRNWLVGFLLLSSPTLVGAEEDAYYVVVFGSQRILHQPAYSHSFGTFVHTCADGRLEYFTISWLPVEGKVRPYALRPETGKNWALGETLDLCRANRMITGRWGPYQIDCDLWNRALRQKERLEGGDVLYQASDRGALDGVVSNCIHALSMIARKPEQTRPEIVVFPLNWGESGSFWIALTYEPWYVEPCRTHDSILCRLGLDPDEFKMNGLDRNPQRNPPVRLLQAATHTNLLPNRVFCDKQP